LTSVPIAEESMNLRFPQSTPITSGFLSTVFPQQSSTDGILLTSNCSGKDIITILSLLFTSKNPELNVLFEQNRNIDDLSEYTIYIELLSDIERLWAVKNNIASLFKKYSLFLISTCFQNNSYIQENHLTFLFAVLIYMYIKI